MAQQTEHKNAMKITPRQNVLFPHTPQTECNINVLADIYIQKDKQKLNCVTTLNEETKT